MKISQIFVIFAMLGVELAAAQKTYGRYYIKQESVRSTVKNNEICQLSFALVRKPRSDRLEGFERLISGFINLSRKIGPVGATITVEKMTENGWKNDYAINNMKRICDFPYYNHLSPFLAHFSGEVNRLDCSINQGNYTIKDWTMEENIRLTLGDKFMYEKYKFTISLTIPERGTPICGFAVVIQVEDLDLLEHSLKNKRSRKH